MRKKEKKSKACEAVKSGLEDENSKSLKIDENQILYITEITKVRAESRIYPQKILT